MGGYLLVDRGGSEGADASPPTPPADVPVVRPQPQPQPQALDDWRSALGGGTCDSPCIGGVSCPSNPVQCTSGLSCIPGTGAERFADVETWTLHLSAVLEFDAAGQAINTCQTRKDFWVCRAGTTTCASQAEACNNRSRGLAAIPVSGAELNELGVTLDVRLGGPTGPTVAVTAPIRHLTRGGLCKGFAVTARGGAVGKVTYFVLPP
jgi:hypothetical protein